MNMRVTVEFLWGGHYNPTHENVRREVQESSKVTLSGLSNFIERLWTGEKL